MNLGSLNFTPIADHLNLVAVPVREFVAKTHPTELLVAEIDANLADTAAFCDHYGIAPAESANCVIVEAKRADRVWYAACLILATTKADVNGAIRRRLDARKVSFAPMETAVNQSRMAYGGITPIGLPPDWPILVDTAVAALPWAVIGSGLRNSKLLAGGRLLAALPQATVLDIAVKKEN